MSLGTLLWGTCRIRGAFFASRGNARLDSRCCCAADEEATTPRTRRHCHRASWGIVQMDLLTLKYSTSQASPIPARVRRNGCGGQRRSGSGRKECGKVSVDPFQKSVVPFGPMRRLRWYRTSPRPHFPPEHNRLIGPDFCVLRTLKCVRKPTADNEPFLRIYPPQ